MSSHTALSLEVHPTHTIDRYGRNVILPRKPPGYECIIPGKTLSFIRSDVPEGWDACQHPEGGLYFVDQRRRIYTDAYICESDTYACVEAFDLVIEPSSAVDDPMTWYYYYANHSNRTLLWIEDYELPTATELSGVPSSSQLSHELAHLYWQHVEYFPHFQDVLHPAINELNGMILFALTDQLTSPASTACFSVADLQIMQSSVKQASDLGHNEYSVTVVARLHALFAHPRFLNYHGEHGARLEHSQSVHGSKPARSYFIVIVAPLLLNVPYVHLHLLEEVWVDSTITHLPWTKFTVELKREWRHTAISAGFLFAVNIISRVIQPENLDLLGTEYVAIRILRYASATCLLGSMITGQCLSQQYSGENTVRTAVNFLYSKSHPTRGVEPLAVLHALPYGLLLWGLLTFLAAMGMECFGSASHTTTYTMAAIWIPIGLVVLWCLFECTRGKIFFNDGPAAPAQRKLHSVNVPHLPKDAPTVAVQGDDLVLELDRTGAVEPGHT